ncbi:MAG: class I tRNA ligase family protein, partial [Candidatus Woesearchaeota archaeon]|nr:class I tRNA ligase family protein [Candidatus Woesearchaeota archaeon]
CTRLGSWLGTKLPFDEKWIVEPISDSTLYPVYYIVSKYVNDGTIKSEQLNERFFDYVFLAKGDIKEVSKSTKLEESLLKRIKDDFEYWYPLDINLGGKEHQTVHFPVFLMNHVAVLHEKHWPKGIFVNWWITGKGSKISKSKGGAEPIGDIISKYGVDSLRLYYSHVGNPHTDIVWDPDLVLNYKTILSKVSTQCSELLSLKGTNRSRIDDWLESKLNDTIRKCSDLMEKFEFREVVNLIYFEMQDSIRWYIRRKGNNKDTARKYVNAWARLMCPLTPFTAEEIWCLSEKGLVSASSWPNVAEENINLKIIASESMVAKCVEDVREVLRLAKIEKPSKITLFVAENWKHEAMSILKKELAVTRDVGVLIKSLMKSPELAERGKDASNMALSVMKDPSKLPLILIGKEEEFATLSDASSLFLEEFETGVEVVLAENSKENKARQAMPGKPAILVN